MIKISEDVFKHLIRNGEDRGSTLGSCNGQQANFYNRFYDNTLFELMEIEEHKDDEGNEVPAQYFALQKGDIVKQNEEFRKATDEFISAMNEILERAEKYKEKESGVL